MFSPARAILAIDPGKSGGIAWHDVLEETDALKMPVTPSDLLDTLSEFENGFYTYLEQVHAMPGNGVSSMFKFGQHLGHIEMALIAAGIPFEYVTPQKWMRAIGVPKKLEKTARKNWIKGRMQELYPDLKVTLATADALGMLTWAMQLERETG